MVLTALFNLKHAHVINFSLWECSSPDGIKCPALALFHSLTSPQKHKGWKPSGWTLTDVPCLFVYVFHVVCLCMWWFVGWVTHPVKTSQQFGGTRAERLNCAENETKTKKLNTHALCLTKFLCFSILIYIYISAVPPPGSNIKKWV